jgi:tetratricopeptide (TPR) repeat protein
MSVRIISIISLLGLTFGTPAQSQIVLKGYVTIQNTGHLSAFPAKIHVAGTDFSTQVDSLEGRFELTLPPRYAPKDVLLTLTKPHFEPTKPLDWHFPIAQMLDNKPVVRLSICPEGQIAQNTRRYYNLFSKRIAELYYGKWQCLQSVYDTIGIANLRYRNLLFKLSQDRQSADAEALAIAENLARTDLDDVYEPNRRYMRLMTEGEGELALRFLMDSQQGQNQQNGLTAKGLSNPEEEKIRTKILSAQLHTLKIESDFSELDYEQSLRLSKNRPEFLMEFTRFLMAHHRTEKANIFLKYALESDKIQPLDRAILNIRFGDMSLEKGDSLAAVNHFKIAVDTLRQLAGQYPSLYAKNYLASYRRLAKFYIDKKVRMSADSAYQQVLRDARNWAERDTLTYGAFLADAQVDIGDWAATKNDWESAEIAFTDAKNIYTILIQKDSIYEAKISNVEQKLGTLNLSKSTFIKAEKHYKTALALQTKMVQTENDDIKALINNHLGTVQKAKSAFHESEKSYTNALKTYQTLAKMNPKVYEQPLAETYGLLGDLYSSRNEYVKGEAAYASYITVKNRLAETRPTIFRSDLASGYNRLGDLHSVNGEFAKAETAYKEALQLYQQLALVKKAEASAHATPDVVISENSYIQQSLTVTETDTDADAVRADLAMTQCRLGNLYKTTNDYMRAEAIYLDMLENDKNIKQTTTSLHYDLNKATTENNLGFLYKNKKEYEKAVQAYQHAIEIYHKLAGTNKNIHQAEIARSKRYLADVYTEQQAYLKASALYAQALTVFEQLGIEYPYTYDSEIGTIRNNYGWLKWVQGDTVQAETLLLSCLEERRKLAQTQVPIYLSDLAATLMSLGKVAAGKKEAMKADIFFAEAFQIRKKLSLVNPKMYIPEVIETQLQLSTFWERESRFAQADSACNAALASYQKMDSTTHTELLGRIHHQISQLNIAQKDYTKAEFHQNKAVQIYQKLGNLYATYQPYLIENLCDWTKVCLLKKDYNKVETLCTEILASPLWIKNESLIAFKDVFNLNLSEAYLQMAQLENLQADKIAFLRKSEALREPLFRKNPNNNGFTKAYAEICGQLGYALLYDKAFTEAETVARKGLTASANEPSCIITLAHTLMVEKRYKDAEGFYRMLKDAVDPTGKPYKYSMLDGLVQLQMDGILAKNDESIEKIRKILK